MCAPDAARIHAAIEADVQAKAQQRLFDLGAACQRIDAASRKRVEELDAAHGCEASAEREFHRGQLVAVAEILKTLGNS